MSWLIELLFGSLRELCSQFIIDMMDIAGGMFTEVLSCDLNLFEGLFGVAEVLYEGAIVPIAIALLLMILVWQLFKSMFGRMGTASEDPTELVFRSCFCLFMIGFSREIVNYILDIAGTPYQWITGTSVPVDSFSGYVSALEAATSALGADAISIQLLMLLMHFVVAWNYFKMLFILAERYVLLGVFSYTSPLAFAMGGSKATNHVLASWAKMFGGQVMVVVLDAWCVKMFLSAYGNLMASGYGFTKFFAATMCLIGFCKITAKLDSYMGSLGVNLGRIAGGMGGFGALMMAGRLLQGGGRLAGGKNGGTGGHSGGNMNFGNGRTIPLGKGTPDFAGFGNGMPVKGQGIGGMDIDEKPEKDSMGASPDSGVEDCVGVFGAQENVNEPILPFGNPEGVKNGMDDQENAMQEGTDGMKAGNKLDSMNGLTGMEDTQGMNTPDIEEFSGEMFAGSEDGLEPYLQGEESPVDGLESWGMDGFGKDSFDTSDMESANGMPDALGPTGIAAESEEMFGLSETTGAAGEISGEQVSEYGENCIGETGQFGEIGSMEGNSGLGAGFGENGLSTGDFKTGYPEIQEGRRSGTLEGGQQGSQSTGTALGAEISMTGHGFDGMHHGVVQGETAVGVHGLYVGADAGPRAESYPGTDVGSHAGVDLDSRAGNYAGADVGSCAGNVEAGVYAGGLESRRVESGMYGFERDRERFMRYDSGMYEKPEGTYQTIYENGKTFYELQEGEKPPKRLPETKAVLERDGTIRLEQKKYTSSESPDMSEQKIPVKRKTEARHMQETQRREKRPGVRENLEKSGRRRERKR